MTKRLSVRSMVCLLWLLNSAIGARRHLRGPAGRVRRYD
jgi:hypothetical protein